MSKARIFVVLFVVAVAATAMLARRGMAADVLPQVGQPAPPFTLPSQDGTPVSLSDFKGKWVVLYFYPKDGTPGCTIEAHNFQKDQDKYNKENAVILGVSVQSTDSHKEFCAKQNLTFRLLSDPDRKVVKAYGSTGMLGMATRNTFLIDPTGKLVKMWIGVDPSKHSGDVLSVLKQVGQSGSGL
jgi:peroxiredoxin Q/BCP